MFARLLRPSPSHCFLFGPRGTGKTTWIREHFRTAVLYDLLVTSESLRLSRDPSLLGRECEALEARSTIVIDEVQKVPALLDEVHRLIEMKKHTFILSGSSARKLRRGASNLLAGRAEVRHLFPLVSKETDFRRPLGDVLEHGMLPMAVTSRRPRAFLKAYAETYLREEVQAEALVRQIGAFARFLEVAARVNAQVVNVSGVARDAGVARQTVQDYFQILVDTLIGFWLPAWKSKPAVSEVSNPKFYLFDCGVTRHLAGRGHMPVLPEERGFLLETCLLHEIRAFLHYSELDYPVFFWRTHGGAEVDFVIEHPRGILALEVKASARWDRKFQGGLVRFRDDQRGRSVTTLGVYTGERALQADQVRVLPWGQFLRRLWDGDIL
jgi:predicted AAA+ superfamily ATPase